MSNATLTSAEGTAVDNVSTAWEDGYVAAMEDGGGALDRLDGAVKGALSNLREVHGALAVHVYDYDTRSCAVCRPSAEPYWPCSTAQMAPTVRAAWTALDNARPG